MGYPHYSGDCSDYHGLVRDFAGSRPQIVCLCGSTRFRSEFDATAQSLTLSGEIVVGPAVWVRSDPAYADITAEAKAALDELHKRKIDLADYVLVLNVGGYIGESTRSEIAYATACHKPVHYLEPITRKCGHCAGEGRTDNNSDRSEQAPWSFWASLPPGSDLAVRFGLVRPQDCVDCGGTGVLPGGAP